MHDSSTYGGSGSAYDTTLNAGQPGSYGAGQQGNGAVAAIQAQAAAVQQAYSQEQDRRRTAAAVQQQQHMAAMSAMPAVQGSVRSFTGTSRAPGPSILSQQHSAQGSGVAGGGGSLTASAGHGSVANTAVSNHSQVPAPVAPASPLNASAMIAAGGGVAGGMQPQAERGPYRQSASAGPQAPPPSHAQ